MVEPLVVPDASVLLKWVLRTDREESVEAALKVQRAWLSGDIRIAVPTLWVFEVANVLGLKQIALADDLLRAMLDLRLPEEPPGWSAAVLFRLMRDFEVTAYDAAYHALAIQGGGIMVTADRRYVQKTKRAGHVRLLDEWA